MRRIHWETLQPVCPRCLHQDGGTAALGLTEVFAESSGVVEQGLIHCSEPSCRQEYPIIDGIPVLVGNVRTYVEGYFEQIYGRGDLHPTLQSVLGDCVGPTSAFDIGRRLLSAYVWDGYEPVSGLATSSLLAVCRDLVGGSFAAPVIDIGCGAGRSTFDLAEQVEGDGLVLGIDMDFSFMRFAQKMLRDGAASYQMRTRGVSYEPRHVVVESDRSRVDFWLCDAMALPFSSGQFPSAVGLNVLDAVSSPENLLREILRVLTFGGRFIFATPFDWSASVTPIESWIGGHSQRSDLGGDPVATLKYFLEQISDDSGARLAVHAERDGVPWRTRMHERSSTEYQNYVAELIKKAGTTA